jgi:RecA/RadA recombinase
MMVKRMSNFDLSLIRGHINAALGKEAVKIASEVMYVDPNNPAHWVVMPPWFKELSTVPGLPFGYIVEFVGLPNAGKTTAGIIALAQAQEQGYITVLIDVERKFPFNRATSMGVNREKLIIISEPTIEENFNVLEHTQKAIHQEYPDAKVVVLYDSIVVGSTRADMGKSTLDPQVMADQAKVLKRMLRRQVVLCAECNCVFIAINQMHGNPNPAAHGAPSLSGGKGIEYAKAISITFQKVGNLPPKTVNGVKYQRGIITKIKTTKNHLQQGDLSLADALLHVTADDMVIAVVNKKSKKATIENAEVDIEVDEGETLE